MAEHCCSIATPQERLVRADHCPGCGRRGRAVSLVTVQAQVAISLQALAAPSYRFCATRDCPVVYFAADAPAITCDQMRERVFQKEPLGDVLVCYCFRYSVGLVQQSDQDQRAAILAKIVAGAQHGRCACAIRNPQGRCCLGNVRRLMAGRRSCDPVMPTPHGNTALVESAGRRPSTTERGRPSSVVCRDHGCAFKRKRW